MTAVRLPALACAMVFASAVLTSSAAVAEKAADPAFAKAAVPATAQPVTQTVALNTIREPMKLVPKPERDSEAAEPNQLLLMLAMFAGLFVFLAHRRGGQE